MYYVGLANEQRNTSGQTAPRDHGALVSYTDTRMTLCTACPGGHGGHAPPPPPVCLSLGRSECTARADCGDGDGERTYFFPPLPRRTVHTAGTPVHRRCTSRRLKMHSPPPMRNRVVRRHRRRRDRFFAARVSRKPLQVLNHSNLKNCRTNARCCLLPIITVRSAAPSPLCQKKKYLRKTTRRGSEKQ